MTTLIWIPFLICLYLQNANCMALDKKPIDNIKPISNQTAERISSFLRQNGIHCSGRFMDPSYQRNQKIKLEDNVTISESMEQSGVTVELLPKETVCLLIENEDDDGKKPHLLTLTYSSLHLNHAITAGYDFAVPELQASCACDCPGGHDHCGLNEDNGAGGMMSVMTMGACEGEVAAHTSGTSTPTPSSTPSPTSTCVRTSSGGHTSAGCRTTDNNAGDSHNDNDDDRADAVLCCRLKVSPYMGRRFAAVELGDVPSERVQGWWRMVEVGGEKEETPAIPFQAEFAGDRWATMHPTSFGHMQLEIEKPSVERTSVDTDDMFYYERVLKKKKSDEEKMVDGDDDEEDEVLMTGVRVLRLKEHDRMGLGWYRYNSSLADIGAVDSKPFIRNQAGAQFDLHRASVRDCRRQLFTETYNAEQYIHASAHETGVGAENVDWGVPVVEKHRWMDEVKVIHPIGHAQRRVEINVRDSTAAPLTVRISVGGAGSMAVRSVEQKAVIVKGWRAAIEHTAHSEHYLHLSLPTGSVGRLVGTVHPTEQSIEQLNEDFVHRSVHFEAFAPQQMAGGGDNNVTLVLKLPTMAVDGERLVCLAPDMQQLHLNCVTAPFLNRPPAWAVRPHAGARLGVGKCDGCNIMEERGWLGGAWTKLTTYISNLSTSGDTLTQLMTIGPWLILCTVILCLCLKCAQCCQSAFRCCDTLCCCCAKPGTTARRIKRSVEVIKRLSRLSVDGLARASVVVVSPRGK